MNVILGLIVFLLAVVVIQVSFALDKFDVRRIVQEELDARKESK